MRGRQCTPVELFYRFRPDDHVPSHHLWRHLDTVLNFEQARGVLAEHCSVSATQANLGGFFSTEFFLLDAKEAYAGSVLPS